MNRLKIILIFVIIPLISYSQRYKLDTLQFSDGSWASGYVDTLLKEFGSTDKIHPKVGIWTSYYKNNKIKNRLFYCMDSIVALDSYSGEFNFQQFYKQFQVDYELYKYYCSYELIRELDVARSDSLITAFFLCRQELVIEEYYESGNIKVNTIFDSTRRKIDVQHFSEAGELISLQKEEMNLLNKFIDSLKKDNMFFKDFSALDLSSVQIRSLGGYDILDFSLTGILADLAAVLAKVRISIFAISTFEHFRPPC